MNKQAKTIPDFDQLIIGMGEAVQSLVEEYSRLELAKTSNPAEEVRVNSLIKDIGHRIHDLQGAIAAVPASGMEAVAIQLRALAYITYVPGEEGDCQLDCFIPSSM